MAPKAGLAAVLGADAVDESIVSFEGGIVLDVRVERLAFEHMSCGMAVALVSPFKVSSIMARPEESGRKRMLAFEGLGRRIEKEISASGETLITNFGVTAGSGDCAVTPKDRHRYSPVRLICSQPSGET
jgi:hypothetical protein